MASVVSYIGLGSNLDNPEQQIRNAIIELTELTGIQVQCCSSLYRSAPMGPQDQPDYVNAVACVETDLLPEALLDQLQALEQAHKRIRTLPWGPRTLDLDLLLYGDEIIDNERLQVPHPGLPERNFVLYPLAEITGDTIIPWAGSLQGLLEHCPQSGIVAFGDPVKIAISAVL